MSVHHSKDYKHTQVKGSSQESWHILGFSHEYVTEDQWRFKTVTPLKPPVRQTLSAHLGVTSFPGQTRTHRRTRDPTEEELQESFLDHLNSVLSRVPPNFCGPKFHPTSPINPLSLIRYSGYTRVSALISLNMRSDRWCVLDDVSEYYIRMFLSFVFLLFPSSVLAEGGKRKVRKKRNKAGDVSHDGRDVMHLR